MLKYTLDQIRDRHQAHVDTVGIPNSWWPLQYGNDCVAYQLYVLGLRSRTDLADHLIGIGAFTDWADWAKDSAKISIPHLAPGDLVVENWNGGTIPEHMEFVYSIDRERQLITTISANTGPKAGDPRPRGVWKKARVLGPAFLHGYRPPYAAPAITTARRNRVKLIAAYLNKNMPVGSRRTQAVEDGEVGPIYWKLVQQWGRLNELYPSKYVIDGIPGPQTRKVEAAIYKVASKVK